MCNWFNVQWKHLFKFSFSISFPHFYIENMPHFQQTKNLSKAIFYITIQVTLMEKKMIKVITDKPCVTIEIQWACLLMSDTAELSKVPIQLLLSRTIDALVKEHNWRPWLKLSTTTSHFQTWKINFTFPTGIIGSRLQRWMSTTKLNGGQLKIYMFKKQGKEKENQHFVFSLNSVACS